MPEGPFASRVLEQYKAELAKRRLGEGSSGGAAPVSAGAVYSDQQAVQQQWQQQYVQPPASKRARVDSGSDLTGAHEALSALAAAWAPAIFLDGDEALGGA